MDLVDLNSQKEKKGIYNIYLYISIYLYIYLSVYLDIFNLEWSTLKAPEKM